MGSRVVVVGSKEVEEAKDNLEIPLRLLIDIQGWGSVEGSLRGNPSGESPLKG